MSDETQPTLPVIVQRIRSIVSAMLSRQVESYAAQLSEATIGVAGQIREIGDEIATRRKSPATRELADSLAHRTERIGRYLKSTDGPMFVTDAQRYGREQPLLASGVALLVGIAAARLLKVSAIGVGRTAA